MSGLLPGVSLCICPNWNLDHPPIGLAALTGYLRSNGVAVSVFDLSLEFSKGAKENFREAWARNSVHKWSDDLFVETFVRENEAMLDGAVRRILATGSRIVGFSVFHSNILLSLEMARRLKSADPERIIVLGGWGASYNTQELIRRECVDAIVVGEGEAAFFEFVRRAGDKQDGACPGVVVKEKGRVLDGGSRQPIEDLNGLPFLDYTDFDFASYEEPHTLALLASRGCVRRCVFCPDTALWLKYRWMSGERIVAEMEQQLKRGHQVHSPVFDCKTFYFCDLLVNGNMRTLNAMADRIIDRMRSPGGSGADFRDATWTGNAIIHPALTLDFLKKLYKADAAISSSEWERFAGVLNKMRKGYRVEVADQVFRDCRKAGVRVSANFMFGFPGETEADFGETLRFLDRNSENFFKVQPSDSFTTMDPFSYMNSHPEEFGVEAPIEDALHWRTVDGTNNYDVRLERYKRFCEKALSLKIPMGNGYAERPMGAENLIPRPA